MDPDSPGPDECVSLNGRHAFLVQQNSHILDSIKFADQKAGGIAALSTGLLYFLLNNVLKDVPKDDWIWRGPVCFTSLVLLAGFLQAVAVLYPQAKRFEGKISGGNLALPQRAAKLSQNQFVDGVAELTSRELCKELAALVYQRCLIREEKYKHLERAFYLSCAGYVLAAFIVMIHVWR